MAYDGLKEKIKEAPISMVIGQFMTLNKKGANLEGLCPFHADTKPSLRVNDAKGMYKCFACGAGGDAITFVKEFKRVDFVEAMKDIAVILGIPFEEYQKEKKKNPKVEMAFRVLNASQKLYQKVAESKPQHYTEFIEKRQLNQESIDRYMIGYAPAKNVFRDYLTTIPEKDRDFAQQVALEIGIVKHNEDRHSYYDFFRDRVTFPIHDHQGQIRGYSTRAVLPDQQQKYMNSGESFVFDKKAILFGFFFGKNTIRNTDQVIIVEGNMDVIMMHQYGFLQTVGTMGTALSDQSIKLLSNMTKNVYLGMDSDAAGKKAMERINAGFLIHGILPKVLTFEPAKDPDEFLLKEGRIALLERIEKAPILLDVLISEIIGEKIPDNLELKLNTLQRVSELISPLKEHLAASERIVDVAKKLGLKSDAATILEGYKTYLSRQKEKSTPLQERPKLEVSEEILTQQEEEARILQEKEAPEKALPMTKSERLVLKEILCHPEFLTHLKGDEFLATIGHPEVKKLVEWLVKIYLEIDDAEYVTIVQDELQYGGYSKDIRDIGTEALFNFGNRYNEKVVARMLKDYTMKLKLDHLKTKRKNLEEKQRSLPSQVEVDLVLNEISKLDKEIMDLKNSP